MYRILDEDSSPLELALIDVGDQLRYRLSQGNVIKIAIIKTNIRENYYYMLDSGQTITINKS